MGLLQQRKETMIDFLPFDIEKKTDYDKYLTTCGNRGCEYSFVNLYLWGKQQVAFLHGCVAFFSHFYGRSVYPYPIGNGDRRAVIEEILLDAKERGIPCRITGMTDDDRIELEEWFPGKFLMKASRNGSDYVYAIDDLADLKGRKYQKKRNHANRFRADHPDYSVVPLTSCNMPMAQHMINDWFVTRLKEDPEGDYMLENIALAKACRCYDALGMDGILLMEFGASQGNIIRALAEEYKL